MLVELSTNGGADWIELPAFTEIAAEPQYRKRQGPTDMTLEFELTHLGLWDAVRAVDTLWLRWETANKRYKSELCHVMAIEFLKPRFTRSAHRVLFTLKTDALLRTE